MPQNNPFTLTVHLHLRAKWKLCVCRYLMLVWLSILGERLRWNPFLPVPVRRWLTISTKLHTSQLTLKTPGGRLVSSSSGKQGKWDNLFLTSWTHQNSHKWNSVLLQKIVEMQGIADAELLEAHITSCHEQADQLSETLMSLELQLVDQLEVRIKDLYC